MNTNARTDEEVLPKLKLSDIVKSVNVAPMLDKEVLAQLGEAVVAGYNLDMQSRQEWAERMADAMKLALQVQEQKSFPWAGASNVKFPLMTIAALQFLARISLLTQGRVLAKVEAIGADPDGMKSKVAKRISQHLSLQLQEFDRSWMDHDEAAKMAASIVGSAFKKTYFDDLEGTVVSEYVPAANFVVDYFCKDIDKAGRVTHLIPMSSNAIRERVAKGVFLELTEETGKAGSPMPNGLKQATDEAEGLTRPEQISSLVHGEEYEVLEQHCWLDLDGDGYAEPYIVFVRKDTAQVLRVVARFYDVQDVHRLRDAEQRELEALLREVKAAAEPDLKEISKLERQIQAVLNDSTNTIVRIDPVRYFTRVLFIPSPDNGVYGLGLGALLGPMNKSVDTLTNQLIDAGTMANTAGGFIGRGAKLKGGKTSFDPFEWKPVDATGDDLRKSMFPLPVREPSAVLFQLLGMLVTYSEKISGATDIMTGVSPGQNTPAETSRNTVEQGMMLFSGIYKRMYRAFREELRKSYTLNRLFLKGSARFTELTLGSGAVLAKDDYDEHGFRVMPAASPEAVSHQQRKDKATVLLQASMQAPGFDKYKVMMRFLEAHEVEDIDEVYPDPAGPRAIAPPPNPKVELEKAKLQQDAQVHADEMQLAIAELQQQAALNQAKIDELQAKATKHLAEAQGVETGHQIAMLDAEIGARKNHQDGMLRTLDLLHKSIESREKAQSASTPSAKGSAPAEPTA
jgi:chaperonin GroES